MEELLVRFEPSGRTTSVSPGTTILAAAHWARVPVASTCGGSGTCGECRVRILEGEAPISEEDRNLLPQGGVAEGWRLACRLEIRSHLTCQLPPLSEQPRAAVAGIRRPLSVEPVVRVERDGDTSTVYHGSSPLLTTEGPWPGGPFGLALDVGTTTVAGALVELASGRTVAEGSVVNHQVAVGADVITRAAFAHGREGGTRALQEMVADSVNGIVEALCRDSGVVRDDIFEAVVVGNPIMTHLLLGLDPHPLAVAPFRPLFTLSQDVAASNLLLPRSGPARPGDPVSVGINRNGRVVTFPLISAYAGGDTVAGLHATDLLRGTEPSLLIDLGTNTEVALGWNGRVVVASAPAGPAFEGAGIRCGVSATSGAVAHLRLGPEAELDVIGGGPPMGICGTGLVDLVAELRRAGLLDATGRLASREEVPSHPLAHRLTSVEGQRTFLLTEGITVSQGDLRELQSAVAAVSAATRLVLHHVGLEAGRLGRVFLAGSFGAELDPLSAKDLALVPPVAPEVVQSVGNAALEGAKAALISFRERDAAFQIPEHAEYLELSGHPLFNQVFLEALEFPPVSR